MTDPEKLREAILKRLADVVHPETGVDVLRMGLIEDLQVDEQGCVSYTFRPTLPLCPLAAPLAVEIRRAVRDTPGVTSQSIQVEGCARSKELTELLHELDAQRHESRQGYSHNVWWYYA